MLAGLSGWHGIDTRRLPPRHALHPTVGRVTGKLVSYLLLAPLVLLTGALLVLNNALPGLGSRVASSSPTTVALGPSIWVESGMQGDVLVVETSACTPADAPVRGAGAQWEYSLLGTMGSQCRLLATPVGAASADAQRYCLLTSGPTHRLAIDPDGRADLGPLAADCIA